jgi:nickel/cobalt transporter (NiCoT) family protein
MRTKAVLTPQEWRCVAILGAAVVGLHVVGFFILLSLGVPHDDSLGESGAFGLGIGMTAYVLGLRHAFDADHIGAIDNSTRKLISEGQRPLSVGFFFSLGHSTVVLLLALMVTLGVRGLSGAVADDGSGLHEATSAIGPALSGSFLLLIGILNLTILVSIIATLGEMRNGDVTEEELDLRLRSRGVMARFFGWATRAVGRPSHMYVVGCLFGLGFDTATEVALLVLAGGVAASDLPLFAIVCLPILFAAGMSLIDTVAGMSMTVAYGWASAKPVRNVFYSVTITSLSVAVALLIGSMELLSVLVDKLGLTGSVWQFAAKLDMTIAGWAIAGLFVVTWTVAPAVWRFGCIEERWSANLK